MQKFIARFKKGGARFVGLFLAIVLGGVLTATALAAIPDVSGLIHGCYASNGSLRVINSANAQCKAGESVLNWIQNTNNGTNIIGNRVSVAFGGLLSPLNIITIPGFGDMVATSCDGNGALIGFKNTAASTVTILAPGASIVDVAPGETISADGFSASSVLTLNSSLQVKTAALTIAVHGDGTTQQCDWAVQAMISN